ncbi:MAG: signal peptidase I [Methylacidiphilales bacterium]|nr:signal peptidase I [Candidatus Methylacidiphilales bacterium]MDW8349562.1 signal peptidase I [Verrucomicrobiae bacterium]
MDLKKRFLRWREYRSLRAHAIEYRRILKKMHTYRRDVLSPEKSKAVKESIEQLTIAIRSQNVSLLKNAIEQSLRVYDTTFTRSSWDWLKENCEVFLVAGVLAFAIKAYFLQPFKIPTGSMWPTLSGIEIEAYDQPLPNPLVRFIEQVIFGRTYGRYIAPRDLHLVAIEPGSNFIWFEWSYLRFDDGSRVKIWLNPKLIREKLDLRPGRYFKAGDYVFSYRQETGDQVLVNKMIYHFRRPERGEIFVFKTTGIRDIELQNALEGIYHDQHYIKRCVGTPGDTLRIDPPYLYVRGRPLQGRRIFEKQYQQIDQYSGYLIDSQQHYLRSPNEIFTLRDNEYFAIGDNARASWDSRYWGPVPARNLVGTPLIVYWPFGKRWGSVE